MFHEFHKEKCFTNFSLSLSLSMSMYLFSFFDEKNIRNIHKKINLITIITILTYLQIKDKIMEILFLYTIVQSHCNRKDDKT